MSTCATVKAARKRLYDPSNLPQELFDRASSLRSESVVLVTGKVRARPQGTLNTKIATGEVEVVAEQIEVLNQSAVLPFPVDDPEVAAKVNEELRLQYRYLDLRRPRNGAQPAGAQQSGHGRP